MFYTFLESVILLFFFFCCFCYFWFFSFPSLYRSFFFSRQEARNKYHTVFLSCNLFLFFLFIFLITLFSSFDWLMNKWFMHLLTQLPVFATVILFFFCFCSFLLLHLLSLYIKNQAFLWPINNNYYTLFLLFSSFFCLGFVSRIFFTIKIQHFWLMHKVLFFFFYCISSLFSSNFSFLVFPRQESGLGSTYE